MLLPKLVIKFAIECLQSTDANFGMKDLSQRCTHFDDEISKSLVESGLQLTAERLKQKRASPWCTLQPHLKRRVGNLSTAKSTLPVYQRCEENRVNFFFFLLAMNSCFYRPNGYRDRDVNHL